MSSAAERVVEAADRVNDPEADAEMGGTGVDDAPPPQKKKQKRNKPTLSCVECVERKTKVSLDVQLMYDVLMPMQCDRTRPSCLACAKRQSQCQYSEIANIIAAR
jgi:hypothetical protein